MRDLDTADMDNRRLPPLQLPPIKGARPMTTLERPPMLTDHPKQFQRPQTSGFKDVEENPPPMPGQLNEEESAKEELENVSHVS